MGPWRSFEGARAALSAKISEARKKNEKRRSDAPEIHATDSECTGWTAYRSAPTVAQILGTSHRRRNAKTSKPTPRWRNIFPRCQPKVSFPAILNNTMLHAVNVGRQ